MKYIFDLDGTIILGESLPLIARHVGKEVEISRLTHAAHHNECGYEENLRRRIEILKGIDTAAASSIVSTMDRRELVIEFIKTHLGDCVVATCNLDCWIVETMTDIGCKFYSSIAIVESGKLQGIDKILRKEDVVRHYQRQGEKVVYIGDSANDFAAMKAADVAICILSHKEMISEFERYCKYVCASTEELLTTLQEDFFCEN